MRRTSIRYRLMVLMICLTTLPVVMVTWIAVNNTRDSVEKEMISANTSRMLWADQYLNELMDQIDNLFYTLQINETFMNSMNEIDNTDPGIQYRTQNVIWDALTSDFRVHDHKVDNLTVYIHPVQKAYKVTYANSGTIAKLDIGTGPWSRMNDSPVNMYFKQTADGIYAYHSLNRFEDHKLMGGLAVRINRNIWEEVGRILQSEADSAVYLINDEGELLSGSTETPVPPEIRQTLRGMKLKYSDLEFRRTPHYFYFMKKAGDGQLTVVKAIPRAVIDHSARATMTAGIWTGSIFAAASVLLSILFSLRISRPIVNLAHRMRTAHIHDFEWKPNQSRDEIGLLERGYNSMMKRIRELIAVEFQQELELKNAQLIALQAQINPHFLNNTLHLIGGMALAKDAPEIYRITRVIGDLLRYSIGTEGDLVNLKDEMQHMRNYLFIQEQRFAGRCSVTLDVDESAMGCRTPKFTLQPVVENAFEHGLQRKEGAWRLEVRVRRVGGRIALMVKDEGVGMTADRLRLVRAEHTGDASVRPSATKTSGTKSRRGIGLRNVDARLKLRFGPGYGVRTFSAAGAGTLVVIVLPAMKGEG